MKKKILFVFYFSLGGAGEGGATASEFFSQRIQIKKKLGGGGGGGLDGLGVEGRGRWMAR